ncbi:MAG: tripartite tricarboxylate transporter TctB family protein [Roseinatronobacter sp.]
MKGRIWRKLLGSTPGAANFNVALGAISILLGIAQLVLIPLQIAEPPRFSGFATIELGPKAMPYVVGWLFVVVGAIYSLVGLSLREENGLSQLDWRAIYNVGVLVAIMIAFVTLLRPIGFVASAGVAGLSIALFYGSRSFFGLAFVGVLAPAAIYLLFTRALSVSLPSSPFIPGF